MNVLLILISAVSNWTMTVSLELFGVLVNLVPTAFPSKKWVGREKALESAGHVYSLNIPEKLIYMQPAGLALTDGCTGK